MDVLLNPIINKSYLVEVAMAASANGNRFYFADIPQLRGKVIYGIEAYTVSHLAKTPQGTTVVADAGKTGIVVTLHVENSEKVYQLPYNTLIAQNQGGFIRMFNNFRINLQKSYVQIVDSTNIVAATCACFNFYYRDPVVK